VPLLVEHFLQKYNEQYRKSLKQLSGETLQVFMNYHWPGNVRELENMVKRMVVLGNESAVLHEIAAHKRPAENEPVSSFLDLDALGVDFSEDGEMDLKAISKRAAQIAEKRVIERVLAQTRWNRKEAAERLQISYKALLYKMKENGLSEGR
jgi:two-component system response regulator AtoC